MAENMLEIRGLSTGYGKVSVVNDIDVSVRPGEWVSIVGNNGAGKTTLLKSVVGLLPATGGSITFDGVDVTRVAPNKRIRMGMAFVPQGQQSFGPLRRPAPAAIHCQGVDHQTETDDSGRAHGRHPTEYRGGDPTVHPFDGRRQGHRRDARRTESAIRGRTCGSLLCSRRRPVHRCRRRRRRRGRGGEGRHARLTCRSQSGGDTGRSTGPAVPPAASAVIRRNMVVAVT